MRSLTVRRCLVVALLVAGVACSATEPDSTEPDPTAAASPGPVDPDEPTEREPVPTTESVPGPPTGSDGPEPGTTTTTLAAAPTSDIEWAECADLGAFAGQVAPLECGTVTAPLDHGDPAGPTIDLALVRRPAGESGDRVGSLVFNPGGPGGSGREFLELAQFGVPDEVAARFDLVSFDPRGVGASTSVDCSLRRDDGIDLIADDDRDAWDAFLERGLSELDTCEFGVDGLASHLGTNNAARDLDIIRAALGDDRLTYVGFSYGTRLGAAYAELFPDRVRALVLDGGVKPTTDFAELARTQIAGFDAALVRFAAACDADPDCLLRELGPALEVIESVRGEIGDLGRFDAGPGRILTPGELDVGILASLYDVASWPFLAQALYLGETTADGELFQVLADSLVGRRPDGSYRNQVEAGAFINCADDPARPSTDEVWTESDALGDSAVFFGEVMRAGTGCLGFPDPVEPLALGPAAGAPPILVIGTTGDPATPYEWSVELAGLLDSGVLYTVEGEGHTAYMSIECVAPIVNAYLLDLAVPDDGEGCVDDAATDFFVPPGESPVDQIVAFFACLRDEGLEIPEVTVADVLADPSGSELFGLLDLSDNAALIAVGACRDLAPG